ncbi:M48 family metallopeptidase [Dechloromonas denitrificans]|uniref:M48 family metallopeptidase n=1 Tax=Dechloromonas denitrificans TaxID=281362 RepID=UPI001CF82637|nr:M48 family metallopeptidase [Dechloromonas denitrificans]UCV12611.1 M48 family metallopeptidase [Dechloromonas denitrificans]
MTSQFTLLFLAAFTLTLSARLWLTLRHIRFVSAHRTNVPGEFAERISLPAHQKAADYTVDRSKFSLQTTLVDAALLLALTLGGGLAWLHDFWTSRLDGLSYGLAIIFSVMLVSAIIDLPFSLYRQFVIEARHGFNRMSLGLFFSDLLKQSLIGLLIGTPVILAVLWLMTAMGSAWWFYVWLFWSAFNLLIMFIYPTWIAPLFNKFSPLEDGEMKTRIEALLARCGFRSSGLFVMDGSKRSSHGNAYFTGFGNNKRIVFFDTLLSRLAPTEVEAVLAHELGHFRKRHILQRIVLMFAVSLGFLWLLGQLIDAAWFYNGLGVPAQNTALALVLFFLVIPAFTFPLAPLGSYLSRRNEFEADAYAAEHASAGDLVRALVKLYEDNASTLTPDPLHSLLYDSHPPAAQRIAHLQGHTA